jgi:hypothetical protein
VAHLLTEAQTDLAVQRLLREGQRLPGGPARRRRRPAGEVLIALLGIRVPQAV